MITVLASKNTYPDPDPGIGNLSTSLKVSATCVASILITLLTASIQAVRAALMSLVNCLKSK
jgi:hypothetical protein